MDQSAALMAPDERVVMISGANRGIGLAIAKRLHADGYRLSLGARRLDVLQTAIADLDQKSILTCRFDAENQPDAKTWVHETHQHFGTVDVLINNAGILVLHDLEDYDETRFERVLEVNVKAPYRLTAAALPHLKQCGRGRIVNINSRSGLRYVSGSADYNISKFANLALTHAPRVEAWEYGVRSTAICPGPSATDMADHLDAEKAKTLTHPDTIAAVVSLVLTLPNNASVPIIPICCDLEAGV